MRILFINSEYPPIGAGAGNASANLARLLVKNGHEVTVATAAHDGLASAEWHEGVHILRGPAKRRHVDRSTVMEQVLFLVGAVYRCLFLVQKSRPDVVLAFFGLPSGAVAWLIRRLYGIPYVVSLRGGDVPGFRPYDFWLYHRIAVPFLRIIWRQASLLVANSTGLRDLARRFDANVDIEIIPNGVDLDRYSAPERHWTSPRILSAGRIVHQKGLDLALEALSGLREFQWSWRVAGDGPQLPSLKLAAREKHLEACISFLGWQGAEQLRQEYVGADLFLFPSRHEGMPNAVLEAMACGLPVIATRIAGNEELVVDGETGLLVPADDIPALRKALRDLLGDGKKRARMGRAGRARVEQGYSWQKVAAEYQSILAKATS
jgi:glycogen synthase